MPRRPRHPRARPTRASNSHKELRVPGHVPTPPRPQTGFARGRLSPKGRPHLFAGTKVGRSLTNPPSAGSGFDVWRWPLCWARTGRMLWWQHPVLYLLHPGELPLAYFDDLFVGVAKALEMNVLEEDLERLANVPKLPSVATDLIQNSLLHV